MNDAATPARETNPFSMRTALVLVLLGSLVFVALLWMIGAGMATGPANDGGSHGSGKGLNGYAAFARFLDKQGYDVRQVRSAGSLDDPGLLILTPPQSADGAQIDEIVARRRAIGPTLVIAPKWVAAPAIGGIADIRKGWVRLAGAAAPHWPGFLDDVGVAIGPLRTGGEPARWSGKGAAGILPVPEFVESGEGERLVPLVTAGDDDRILAAYVDDGGHYPALAGMALEPPHSAAGDEAIYPIVLVFEPDLLNNYGFADAASARLADRLVSAAADGAGHAVRFDLTLNGHGRSANLLTLAFTPPFLAATLCLLMAGFIVGWRAFVRFGPPRQPERAIAFGKTALVGNAAGLMRRARRLHLIAGPYIDRARERIALALALPRGVGADATDAAIDRALASRSPDAEPFTVLAARLRSASRPHDIVSAARDLHALERTLTR